MRRWVVSLAAVLLFAFCLGCGGEDPKNKDKEKGKDKPLPAEKAADK